MKHFQLEVRRFQVMKAGDDETCMQLQTYMIQSACNKDMIFHPKQKEDMI